MTVPQVSVLMPSYNHAAYVKEAVESVLTQTYADFEFVITDDGSNDGTPEIIRGFDDPRIKLEILETNQGAAAATNSCLTRSKGKFVAFINSDDFFFPDKIEKQVAFLSKRPDRAAVFSQVRFVDEGGSELSNEINPFANLFTSVFADRYARLNSFFFKGNGLCHPSALVRRCVCEELGPYDVSLRQLYDFDMWVRLCARYEIAVMPEALLAYRVLTGGGNASTPGVEVLRRTSWEHTRVRRRFREMDENTLHRAFANNIAPEIAVRKLPMALRLALSLNHVDAPQLCLFALETVQDALDLKIEGLSRNDLHSLSGARDPLRQIEYDSMMRTIASLTKQRDEARLQVEGLSGYLIQCIDRLRARACMDFAKDMECAMAQCQIGWLPTKDDGKFSPDSLNMSATKPNDPQSSN